MCPVFTSKTDKSDDEHGYLHNLQFLVVEDSSFMREILREVLMHFDVRQIREANDGAEALSIMKTWSPDIILLDWEMQPFDGIEFTRTVRNQVDSEDRFVPIIMVSAHSEFWRIQQARNVGVNEFLVKPVSPRSLFSRIRAVIERPRQYISAPGFFGPDRRRQDLQTAQERRADNQEISVPDEQLMEQDQINAMFNPDSDHPDDQVQEPTAKP
ncbi:response regulator [Magnetovibrio sp. PR-2]|uniref:response regulator n=1 Tax=Magnetovibrio sp. PR-2 TaxID=3120356 RepID=UPI002FCE4AA1